MSDDPEPKIEAKLEKKLETCDAEDLVRVIGVIRPPDSKQSGEPGPESAAATRADYRKALLHAHEGTRAANAQVLQQVRELGLEPRGGEMPPHRSSAEPAHDHPPRRLQLRAAQPHHRRRAVRISMCHCLECQRRTGAVISNQARFRREQIAFAGKSTAWTRSADSGNALTFHFCPICGSTVYWEGAGFPGYVAVAIGTLADPTFPPPTIAVWEEARHPWVTLPPDTPPKRVPKQG